MPLAADVDQKHTDVLLALLLVYNRDGRATVRSVGKEAGIASTQTVHERLLWLKEKGLVKWEPEKMGTLRPAVKPVKFRPVKTRREPPAN